jgi:hypothetical protein
MRSNEDDATVCLRKQQGKGILDEEKALESRQYRAIALNCVEVEQ